MSTVGGVMMRLLPHGTSRWRGDEPAAVDWRRPPSWPPDLFAVAATLVNLSGAYAHTAVTVDASGNAAGGFAKRTHELGEQWARLAPRRVVRRVVELWIELLDAWPLSVSVPTTDRLPPWCHAALELMAIADEAAAGFGFPTANGRGLAGTRRVLAATAMARHFPRLAPGSVVDPGFDPRRAPSTLCKVVPPEQCCVQAKSRTPQVGCTLRSLSHNLALLPPIGEVTTSYLVSPAPMAGKDLNLLLVPFPFARGDWIDARGLPSFREKWGSFAVRQTWSPPASADRMAAFLGSLIDRATAQTGARVDGVVLPELALSETDADGVATRLAGTGLRLFITGALGTREAAGPAWNGVQTYLFHRGKVLTHWRQSKHHRWRLEKGQVDAYDLDLDKRLSWWEHIDVANRMLTFYAFHEGATLATLVCEDLARIDPVQPALRAVGPNLLIALLLDGPQLPGRWPGRYATVLADDPGTSVLTLTSVGLVDRSNESFHGKRAATSCRAIGLWKQTGGDTTVIELPRGSHGVLLRLELSPGPEEFTMDRRGDHSTTTQVKYLEHKPVRLRREPPWLRRRPAGGSTRAPIAPSAKEAAQRFELGDSGYPLRNPWFDQAIDRLLRGHPGALARLHRFDREWATEVEQALRSTRYRQPSEPDPSAESPPKRPRSRARLGPRPRAG